jgi:site-specific DNA-methyltransferase (adenine-specific)
MPQTIETVRIDELEPHPANPRQGDVGLIHSLIEENGWYGVIVAQRSSGRILAGNHRWKAAKAAGMSELPVAYLDVDDDRAERILLADNRSNDLASYDDHALADLLQTLTATDHGLLGTGYDGDDLDQLLHDLNGDQPTGPLADPEPSVPEQAQERWHVTLGDVWQAGEQTVVCGDSTDQAAWQGVTGNAMWTDPPYGVVYGGDVFAQAESGSAVREAIHSDDLSSDDLEGLVTTAILGAPLNAGAAAYVAAPPGPLLAAFLTPLVAAGWLHQCLAWVKHRMTPGRSDYHYQHEMILYGWKPGAAHQWYSDRTQTSILEHDRPHTSAEHPTMKPVSLVAECLQNSTKRGDVVLDPFLGSGSTLLAAHQLGRAGTGIELDPRYCAVTLDRLASLGLTAEKTSG